MGDLVPIGKALPAMTPEAVDFVRNLEAMSLATRPQNRLRIEQELHAGIYARTMYVDQPTPGTAELITGALIKIPTLLVWQGEALVYIGEDDPRRLSGYGTLKAAPGRKQAFLVFSEFRLTMSFATKARTVEEAENEFTDEAHMLQTRRA